MDSKTIHLKFGTEGGSLALIEQDDKFFVIMNQVALLDMMDEEDAAEFEPVVTTGPFESLGIAMTWLLEKYPHAFKMRLMQISAMALEFKKKQEPPELLDKALERLIRPELQKCIEHFEANPDYGTWQQQQSPAPNVFNMPFFVPTPMCEKLNDLMYLVSLQARNGDWVVWKKGTAILVQDRIMEQDQQMVCKLTYALLRRTRLSEGAWVGVLEDGTVLKLAKRYLQCYNH